MAEEINNGELGAEVRQKINSNFQQLESEIGLRAEKDSPALTGTPTAPTPDASDDSTKIATTAFVKREVSGISGTITAEEKASIRKAQYLFNPLTHPNLIEAYEADSATILNNEGIDVVLELIDKVGGVNKLAAAVVETAPILLDRYTIDFLPTSSGRLQHSNPSDFGKFSTNRGEIIGVMRLGGDDDDTNLIILDGNAVGTTSFTFKTDALGRPRISYNDGTTNHNFIADVAIAEGYHAVSWLSTGSEWKIFIDGVECRSILSGSTAVNSGAWWGNHDNPNAISRMRITGSDLKLKALYFFNDVLSEKDRWDYVREFRKKFDLDEFVGLKLVSYGDSITATAHWQKYVCQRLGLQDINRGIGGTHVKDNGETDYVDPEGHYLAGDPPAGVEGVDYFLIHSSMCHQERIDTIPLDADIILVFGGANDSSATGTIDDPADEALDTSFYAAYKTMLNRIHTRCPNALIALITPPHHATADATLTPGAGYDGVRKAIREIGYLYSYPIIDLKANAQINANNHTQYLSDQVHPNDAGGRVMAMVIAHELGKLKPFLQ